jgi:hypothetical protein
MKQGIFPSYGIVEVEASEARRGLKPEDLTGVDFDIVRLMRHEEVKENIHRWKICANEIEERKKLNKEWKFRYLNFEKFFESIVVKSDVTKCVFVAVRKRDEIMGGDTDRSCKDLAVRIN